jgi:hypothetical protein
MPIETFTRTGQDIADDVQAKFGDTGQVQITNDMILDWINSGQREIASNGFTLEATSTTNLIGSQSVYDLSAITDAIRNVVQVRVNGAYVQMLQYPEFAQFVRDNTATNSQSGIGAIYAGVLHLWPAPAASIVGGLVIDYTAYPADLASLASTLTVPNRFFQALADWVLAQALELDENYDAGQTKLGHYENRITKQLARTHESPSDYFHVVEPKAEWD